jgi:hypothetical protein
MSASFLGHSVPSCFWRLGIRSGSRFGMNGFAEHLAQREDALFIFSVEN